MPSLARFVPPAKVLDKHVYSPWTEGRLDAMLTGSEIDTLVITGGETDVCVLATVLGAIDRGFRVVLVTDAICSSADQTHDALMELYRSRFSRAGRGRDDGGGSGELALVALTPEGRDHRESLLPRQRTDDRLGGDVSVQRAGHDLVGSCGLQ